LTDLFGEDGTTVQRWVRRFEDGGLDALREGERAGRPRALDAKQWRSLQGDLPKTPRDFGLPATLWDGPVLSEHLRRRYAVDLGVRQCQRLFRQMQFRLRKPRPQVAQSDPLKVAAVKKLRRLARRADVELWSLDECHFQQHGSRCRMWVPPEIKDPILRHAPTRKSVACFGAVSLSSGQFVRMMCPMFNAATFQSFLKRLLRQQAFPLGKSTTDELPPIQINLAQLVGEPGIQ